jgi:hypothetical protein
MKKGPKKTSKRAKAKSKPGAKKTAAAKPAKKPAARSATAPRSSAGGAGTATRGRYAPKEIPGTGWPPFRYPPV